MISCCFGGPFSVMTVCNALIFRTVRASRKRVSKVTVAPPSNSTDRTSSVSSESGRNGVMTRDKVRISDPATNRKPLNDKKAENTEYKLALSLIVVVIVFVICWLPYCISMLIQVFYPHPVPRGFHMFTLILGYANSCCNPIIYGVMNTQFAKGFKDLGSVVQSIVSLTSSLRGQLVKCFTAL